MTAPDIRTRNEPVSELVRQSDASPAIGSEAAGEADSRIAALESEVAKLRRINNSLIRRVELNTDHQGNSFSLFQTAILLENQVRDRTEEVQQALWKLEESNRELSHAKEEADTAWERLYEAIESLSEGFALFDRNDRLVLSNSKYKAFFSGLGSLIVPGISFTDFIQAAVVNGIVKIAGDDREAWIARRLARHREPGAPVVMALSDGRWLQVNERPTKRGGTVGIYTDVTEIKKSEARQRERALEEKSIELTATLDNLVQGVSVFDRDRKLAYWNTRFLLLLGLHPGSNWAGLSFDEIMGQEAVRDAFPSTDLIADVNNWSAAERSPGAFRVEYRRFDGMVVEVRRNAMPGGGFISTYTDVTDQRRAAKVLEEAKVTLERRVAERTLELTELNEQLIAAKSEADRANLSKTKFLAAASHDLLQPLSAARLFLSAMPDRGVTAEARHLIERVETALESVDGLLKALFDISKLDTGVIIPEFTSFPAGLLLNGLAEEVGILAERKGLTLEVVPSSAIIRSDVLLLRRILQNVISNAIRYTESGRVLLGCRRRRNGLSIQVWDTGPGIPSESYDTIFEEFRRLDQRGTGSGSGFGLGLAIARRSALILGNQLSVASEVGRGSVFSIEVPYGQASQLAPGAIAPPLYRNLGLSKATIVFIENDEDNLEAMTALLNKWSCQVLRAHDSQEALEVIDGSGLDPDLVIADYHLDRDLVGLDAIDEVRRHCGLPIPGMIVTADHTAQVQEAVKRAGYELLQKPIKPAELRSLMFHVLA